ncbi:TRAP transporter small permease subunit [Marinobacterium aestuariivivens]|uniref:TRAP transporter small permease protein n=1 Tax=Marinobacterium aestuariivivens TaxID=1698799 RepID=A0ABW2A5T7_9GAMM
MKKQSTQDSEAAEPLPNNRQATKLLTPMVVGMDTLGAVIVLAMMVIVNLDVFGRWLADTPLDGTLELTEMGIVAVVYLQLAHAIAAGRLTRSDTLLGLLERRARRLNLALRAAFDLAGGLVLAIIVYGQAPRLIDAWNAGYYKGNIGIFTAPTWPLEAILLIGATLASIQFFVLALRHLKAIRSAGQ